MRALTTQISCFKARLGRKPYKVSIEGCDTDLDLLKPIVGDELHIYPLFAGSAAQQGQGKGSGFSWGMIAVGAVLVAAAFIPGLNVLVAGFLLSAGAGLMLGGVAQLLSPAPKADDPNSTSSEASKYFGAPGNTIAIGTRIPIIYGRAKVGGHILSYDVRAVDVSA